MPAGPRRRQEAAGRGRPGLRAATQHHGERRRRAAVAVASGGAGARAVVATKQQQQRVPRGAVVSRASWTHGGREALSCVPPSRLFPADARAPRCVLRTWLSLTTSRRTCARTCTPPATTTESSTQPSSWRIMCAARWVARSRSAAPLASSGRQRASKAHPRRRRCRTSSGWQGENVRGPWRAPPGRAVVPACVVTWRSFTSMPPVRRSSC
jgi:hypothetical protein